MVYKFKEGQIVLFNNNSNFISKQITNYNLREYKESKATHAGIISKVDNDKIYIFEIVKLKSAEHYEYDKLWIENKIKDGSIIIREPKIKLTNLYNVCNSYIDIHYSIIDLFSILLFGLTNIKLSLSKMRSVICSELVVRILYDTSLKKIDFKKEFNKPYDLITPMDIYYSKQLKTIK